METSFRLWRYAAAVSVLASAMSVPIAADVAVARGTPVPQAAGDATLIAGAFIGVLVTAVVAVVVVALAGRMRRGTSWARTVLAVVGTAIVVVGLLSLGGTIALFGVGLLGPLVALLSLVSLVLVAAAVSFMFRPGAASWFDR
ncbi:hypothetical protein [Pseudonocardia sp.]|uniref:hypothetical protein n=1 Tax=Pseudonocardia sp. TaxID=60912 RepID=UPI003D09CF52